MAEYMKKILDTRKNPPKEMNLPLTTLADWQAGTGTVVGMVTEGPNAGAMRIAIYTKRGGELSCHYDTLTPQQVQEMVNNLHK